MITHCTDPSNWKLTLCNKQLVVGEASTHTVEYVDCDECINLIKNYQIVNGLISSTKINSEDG